MKKWKFSEQKIAFILRQTEDGTPEEGRRPVIYRLNLMRPESNFIVMNGDVLYIANTCTNQTGSWFRSSTSCSRRSSLCAS